MSTPIDFCLDSKPLDNQTKPRDKTLKYRGYVVFLDPIPQDTPLGAWATIPVQIGS